MTCIVLRNVEMPTMVNILTFISIISKASESLKARTVFIVHEVSRTLFKLKSPNLVCGYIFGTCSVAYYFRVTVNLTPDFSFCKKSCPSKSPILFEIGIPNVVFEYIFGL